MTPPLATTTLTAPIRTPAAPSTETAIQLRMPRSEDGFALHQLVARCAPLDPNSVYCNLLQCSHFAGTAVAAERAGELVGFVSGYIPPTQPDTLFIWQVAVDARARGAGLARRMLLEILRRDTCREVRYIETTITPDNAASWALFRGLARTLDVPTQDNVHFDCNTHFGGQHASEHLLRIGPFDGVH